MIANCEVCDRKKVPVAKVNVPGEPLACFLCQGDSTTDPYCEAYENKENRMSDAITFNNGLSQEHDDEIDQIMIDLGRLNERIGALGSHRCYSLATTKIEEAKHWMRDRKGKPNCARPA